MKTNQTGDTMKKSLIASLLSLAAINGGTAWSQPASASWASLPSGAREAGLAGGLASLAQGLEGSRLNPASLATVKGYQVEASHDQWVQGVSQEQGAMAMGLGTGLGAALAADWLDMGEVTRYQTQAGGGLIEAGTWHPTAGSLTMSLGAALGSQLAVGAAIRGWRQDLDLESALAASGSASFSYSPSPALSVVGSILDIGTPLAGDPLPSSMRLGASWTGRQGQRLALEATAPLGQSSGVDVAAAVEAPVGKSLTLRGGGLFASGSLQPVPTMGFSVAVSSISLDFAYSPSGALGSTLNAGLSWTTF
jgi:hypothetical protein